MARIVCFGEVLARLSTPGAAELAFTNSLDVHIGGAEANVAAALAWLGHDARLVTALPDGPLGERALVHLRSRGVACDSILRGPGRLGLYFVSTGASRRPSDILYDRADSLFVRTDWAAIDWNEMLRDADLLHVSGISLALGDTIATAVLTAMRSARDRGIRVAFDGNFRRTLWQGQERDPGTAIAAAVALTDIFFGDYRDAGMILSRNVAADFPRAASLMLFDAFPTLSLIAATGRRIESHGRHHLSARIDTRLSNYTVAEQAVDGIVDRIGGGDAFAAGVLDAWLDGREPEIMAERGLTLACLKHAQYGDAAAVNRNQLETLAEGTLDVQR